MKFRFTKIFTAITLFLIAICVLDISSGVLLQSLFGQRIESFGINSPGQLQDAGFKAAKLKYETDVGKVAHFARVFYGVTITLSSILSLGFYVIESRRHKLTVGRSESKAK
jgi:hypothetical protein